MRFPAGRVSSSRDGRDIRHTRVRTLRAHVRDPAERMACVAS